MVLTAEYIFCKINKACWTVTETWMEIII